MKPNTNRAPGAIRASFAATMAVLIGDALRAQPEIFRNTPDASGDFRVIPSPVPAAAMRVLPLLTAAMASTDPVAAQMMTEIAGRSRLAALGMQVIAIPMQGDPIGRATGTDGPIALSSTALPEFSVTGPAPFAEVFEDQQAALSPYPADVTLTRASGLRQQAFRLTLTRSMLKDRPTDRLAAEIAEAILTGLGRMIDRTALASLATGDAQPAVGTARTAMAAGVDFADLHAVIGTGALAVEPVADQGRLFHSGVPATATDQAAPSFLGDWRSHAVAVADEMTILARKVANTGALELSVWTGATGLSPTPRTRLWRLAGA